MKHMVYKTCWAIVFTLNLVAVILCFTSRWEGGYDVSKSFLLVTLVILWLSAMAANIVVTDIAAEYICILLGAAKLHGFDKSKEMKTGLLEAPECGEPYIVVYCLKSKVPDDIDDTLASMEKSWQSNKDYPNAVYLILSGTSDEELYAGEREAIDSWNALHSEDRVVCRYLRRNRSILYKYGQYLDFIMLINGHDGTGGENSVALYKDALPEDGTGCFDASSDVDYFKGRLEFDRLVILDKDNVLGVSFFAKANSLYRRSDCDIAIIQPAIVSPDNETRTSDGSDTFYGSFTMASHDMGSQMAVFRSVFFPSATFFGKGVIRRTKYNELLLGYNCQTYTTEEGTRLPRDLVSHDIIESSIMTCVKDSTLEIIEGFPGTCLEWHLRQSRWDRGDLILSKYLFAWSYGLPANFCSRFSNSSCIPFYSSFASKSTVHTGTFNVRVIAIRPLVVLAILLYSNLGGNTMLFVSEIYMLEILLVPFVVKIVTATSFSSGMLLTIHDMYIGAIDIYYGTARTIRALVSIAYGVGGWSPFGDEGHTPLITMLQYCRCVLIELVVALCLEIWCIKESFDEQGHFRETHAGLIIWLGFVLVHPFYVFATAHKVSYVSVVQT
ncbi:unnamed protein product [Ectocarpus sp. 12 AP-2014]